MTEASSRYGCFDWRAEAIVSSTSAFANAPIPGQKVHVVALELYSLFVGSMPTQPVPFVLPRRAASLKTTEPISNS